MIDKRMLLVLVLFLPAAAGQTSGTVAGTGASAGTELDFTVVSVDASANALYGLDTSDNIVGMMYHIGTNVWFASWDGTTVATTLIYADDNTPIAASANIAHVSGTTWIGVWQDDVGNQWMFAKSTNDGSTWSVAEFNGPEDGIGITVPRLQVQSNLIYAFSGHHAGSATALSTYTMDGGASWSSHGCTPGSSRNLMPGYFHGAGGQVRVIGPKTNTPDQNVISYIESEDSCATLETLDGPTLTQTYSASAISTTGTVVHWVGGAGDDAGYYTCPGKSTAANSSDGIWFWSLSDWNTPKTSAEGRTGALLFTDSRDTSCSMGAWDSDTHTAFTYRTDTNNLAGRWLNVFEAEDMTTALGIAGTGGAKEPGIFGDQLVFAGPSSGLYLWYSGPVDLGLPDEEGEAAPTEPSEFDSGFVAFVTSLGFISAESQTLVALILVGVTTVSAGAMSKTMSPGRLKNTLVALAGILVALFCVVLVFLEMWVFVLALVLAVAILRGAAEMRNTWRELVQSARELGKRVERPPPETPAEQAPVAEAVVPTAASEAPPEEGGQEPAGEPEAAPEPAEEAPEPRPGGEDQ